MGSSLAAAVPCAKTAGMTLEERAAELSAAEIVRLLQENQRLRQQTAELQQQTAWFKRQLFGVKSERRLLAPDQRQLRLAGMEAPEAAPPPPTEPVKAYRRRQPLPGADDATAGGLRFDASVPVEEIAVPHPEVAGRSPEEYEVIGEKVTYRLAQKPGAYVVLKYVRQVIKLKETAALSCPPAPPAVFEQSVADVSFLAGLLLDKFRYHLPLYRQHQRLAHAGITLSRVTLTNLVHRTAALLEPLYYALLSSILQSQVLLMDETPIKAGRTAKGKLHTGYFWPIYGDQEEVAFPFAASRAGSVVREALGRAIALKALSKHELREIDLVPAGFEAFVLDAEFGGRVLAQEIQCDMAQDGEIFGGMALADPAVIFAKGDI